MTDQGRIQDRIEVSNGISRVLIEGGSQPLQISLLRTCKQIHTAAKHLLWKYNTLHLGWIMREWAPAPEGMISLPIVKKIKDHIQSVSLDVDLLFDKTIADRLIFGYNLTILATWIQEGSLSSITLFPSSIIGGVRLSHRQLGKVLQRRGHPVLRERLTYYKYLQELRLGTLATSSLSTVKKQLVIDTGVPTFERETWKPKQRITQVRSSGGNPLHMLHELAIAWGGRLEVNDVLVFEDGNPVEDIFLEESDPPIYYFKDDVHLWLMTEVVKDPLEGKHIGDYLCGMDRSGRAAYYRKFEDELEALKFKYGFRSVENLSIEESKARTEKELDVLYAAIPTRYVAEEPANWRTSWGTVENA